VLSGCLFFFTNICPEFSHLIWDYPRLWEKTEVDRILVFHFLEARGQLILFCNSTHVREVIYPLESLDLGELLRRDKYIVPNDIYIGMSVCLFFFYHFLLSLPLLFGLFGVTFLWLFE
jgi:hypothetical protein